MENDVLTPYLFLIFPDLSDYKANSTLHPDFTLIIFAQAYALCFLLAALFSTIHAFSNKCIISFYILPFKLHTVPANGRLCGAERPRCGASGHPLSYID